MRKGFKVITLLLIALVWIVGTSSADDLAGEFSLSSTYMDSNQSDYPTLETALDLSYKRSSWSDDFLLELNFSGDLKNSEDFKVELGEAYYKYYGTNYELGVGQQRISWGTAVQFNPTDNLNPVNTMDLFAEKKAVPILQGSYYFDNNIQLMGVIIPDHYPALDTITIQGQQLAAKEVADDWDNIEYAIKLSAKAIKGYDYSLSYYHGYEDLPTIGMRQTPMGLQPDPSNIYFREYEIIGADLATSYQGVGFWAETAYFKPQKGEEYYSLVLGADYKLSTGHYLEGQAIYQKDKMLNENILLQAAVEKDLLTIHNFRTGLVYNTETKGLMIKPEIDFSLREGVILNINYQYVNGDILKTTMAALLPVQESSLNLELKYAF